MKRRRRHRRQPAAGTGAKRIPFARGAAVHGNRKFRADGRTSSSSFTNSPYMVVTEFYIDMENPQLPSATSIQAELYAVAQPGDVALDAAATEGGTGRAGRADAAGA